MVLYDPQAAARREDEDEWEPPERAEDAVPPLDELKAKISSLIHEHQDRGKIQISGRLIVVCHQLPYQCKLLRSEPESGVAPIAFNLGDQLSQPQPLHSPTQLKRSPSCASSNSQCAASRWILSPRRGHAALNSGIRSLADKNTEVTLIAWPSELVNHNQQPLDVDVLTDEQKQTLEKGLDELANAKSSAIRCVPVWLSNKLVTNYYDGYCKSTLWPTFHYFALSDHQDAKVERDAWEAYVAANQAYADRVVEAYQEGDMIWVHDYHLLLVPQLVKQKIPNACIGLFIHAPFPSSEFFRCLPRRENLLKGMLGANLCCFQTYSYGRHFLSSCVRVLGYEPVKGGVEAKGVFTGITHLPIGIDVERCQNDRMNSGVMPKIQALRQLYHEQKIIIGRDKLDGTKGVLPKLQAFEQLLQEYPEWIGKVVLIQVTSPSPHDSPVLARKVSEQIDHINSTYGSLSFLPVHHYHQTIERDEYFALLTVADLALITSIRDGMNTTSMEYVICQEQAKAPLILSEFTGVTGSMKQAVRVNPWDSMGCAHAINDCLNMSEEEKIRRHSQLFKRVTTHTAAVWAHGLELRLLECLQKDQPSDATPPLDQQKLLSSYKNAKKRILLFDYDGTLTPIVKVPSEAVPSEDLKKALPILAADPKNVVYIISGRDRDFLELHMGHIKGLGLSAEHGCFVKEPGQTEWSNLTEAVDMNWMSDVEQVFKYYEDRTTGSFVEKKSASVTFHYRGADPTFGEFQAKECQAILDTMASKLPIDILVGKKNLEVRPAFTHKGEIVSRVIFQNPDVDFALCAGDDATDENMFQAFQMLEASGTPMTITPPLAMSLPGLNPDNIDLTPRPTSISPDNIYTLAILPPGVRKTVGKWQLDEAPQLVSLLSEMAS